MRCTIACCYTAGNGAAVGESYDYTKAAISLERSNSFPWPKDCVQIHQTLFSPQGWGLGTRQLPLSSYSGKSTCTQPSVMIATDNTIPSHVPGC